MQADYYIMKLARDQKGLSQRDLATMTGLAPATILKAEHGASISPRTWKKIKDALGIATKRTENDSYILEF